MQDLIEAAARNRAILCDRICRAQGIGSRFLPGIWRTTGTAPPLLPDAITLPGMSGPPPQVELRALLAGRPRGLTVMDSAAALDLGSEGYAPLADADWITRNRPSPPPAPLTLVRIAQPADLGLWEGFWRRAEDLPEGHVQFPPDLIQRRDIAFLAHLGRDARPRGGGILLHGAGVVSVSNLFSLGPQPEALFAAVAACAARLWPGRPVVGCESGARLDAARIAGFTPIGPLRLWRHPGSAQ
ncbi:hypothetical protein [Frigidibacter sp. ROC022]|uniref:hypothetical protein n=1 Tax=Frigidibacter sp. ROC022 TaxID=2971796 RepID=UPI00215B5D31|nr:hypothetical protein [Frigidibacter sp. ROC022]MCR8725640.1 hypothetical protein [Frigidibacter sp. ROC022]